MYAVNLVNAKILHRYALLYLLNCEHATCLLTSKSCRKLGIWGKWQLLQVPKQTYKGKGTFHSRTDHEGSEGERYRSTLSLASVLDGLGGQRHAPRIKTWYPLYR